MGACVRLRFHERLSGASFTGTSYPTTDLNGAVSTQPHDSLRCATTGKSTFFLDTVSCGGVRLSPLGTSATNWPIGPAPDDRWV
jgi:hypothetical protein